MKIAVLGSTGSIGKNTLSVVRRFPDLFQVVGLAAHTDHALLERQIKEFRPIVAALQDKKAAVALARRIKTPGTEILSGIDGILEVARCSSANRVVSAIVGSAGLLPTLAAILAKKTVALANKESLVMAGELVMREASAHKVDIIPIDSEHSALFQILSKHQKSEIKRVILTASGGPLWGYSEEKKKNVSCEEALAHPTWKMGPKISIDSATLMNKGFEIIEARWLFDLPEDQIDVMVHPQSIVHSMVEFTDRSIMAQMGHPNMQIPISYALSYPQRGSLPFPSADLTAGPLTFALPPKKAFPLVTVARNALKTGGTLPAVLNAANEGAVHAFLAKKIKFPDIYKTIRKVVDAHKPSPIKSVEDVMEADRWGRWETEKYIRG